MKIALGQIDIYWEEKEKNQEKCLEFIKRASSEGAEFIVFPEMTLTGFSMRTLKIGEKKAETVKWFSEKANAYDISIGFGFVELDGNKGKNNFSICSKDKGEMVRYTKLHPFSYGAEDKYYLKGNAMKFFSLKEFNFSMFICYDLRFPEIFQAAGKKCDTILVIANWPESRRKHWIALLKARAIETQCYIIGVNRVGIGEGIKYSGDSMIVDPNGQVIKTVKDREELIICDLNIDEVKKCRNEFKFKDDRREELYSKFMKED